MQTPQPPPPLAAACSPVPAPAIPPLSPSAAPSPAAAWSRWDARLWGDFATGHWEQAAGAGAEPQWRPLRALPPAVHDGSVHVLVIGDSVDRFTALELCAADAHGGSSGQPHGATWADDELPYVWVDNSTRAKEASWHCQLGGGDSWAMVHHYGAKPAGPYFRGYRSRPGERFTDTAFRLPRALELYQRVFRRRPTHVVYQTNIWDIFNSPGGRHTGAWLAQLSEYIEANVAVVGGALAAAPAPADGGLPALVGLRTTPTDFPLAAAVNGVLRGVAARLGLPLLDWAAMVLSLEGHTNHSRVYRDTHHPNAAHNLVFARRLLELARAESRARGPLAPSVDVRATPSAAPTLAPVAAAATPPRPP
jgi:hypothetical protein